LSKALETPLNENNSNEKTSGFGVSSPLEDIDFKRI
jgi:hypothetical protein